VFTKKSTRYPCEHTFDRDTFLGPPTRTQVTDEHSAGKQILAVRSDLQRLRPWVDSGDRERIRTLQLELDAKAGHGPSFGFRLDEIKREIAWRASEIDGCQRALQLVPDAGGGTLVRDSSPHRLVARMERRGAEIAAFESDVRRIEETHRQRDFDSEVAEQRLLAALQEIRASAQVAKQMELAATHARRQDRTRKELASDEMWSPVPVLGYRIWAIDRGALHGAWRPWQSHHLVAECEQPGAIPHTDGRCASIAFGCGIYAAKSVVDLLGTHAVTVDMTFVVGLVGLEGRVVEHERGYRAEEVTVQAAAVGSGRTLGHPEVRYYPTEHAVSGLFVDFEGTLRDEEADVILPVSTKEMFAEIKHFMDIQTRRQSEWT